MTIKRLLLISRPILWINTLGPALIGLWLTGSLWNAKMIVMFVWLSLPFNLLIYGINDISDIDVDTISARKGGIEGICLQKSDIVPVIIATLVFNLPFLIYFSWQYNWDCLAYIYIYIIIFLAYSAPPIRFKARPLLDSISNGAYALPLAFIPLMLEHSINYYALIGLALWSMAKQTFDSIQDQKDDILCDLETTAVSYGIKFAMLWSFTLWIGSTIMFYYLNVSVAIVITIGFLILLVPLLLQPTVFRAHELYKFSIFYPYIAGTYAGVLLVIAITYGYIK